MGFPLPWNGTKDSWRFAHHRFRHYPVEFQAKQTRHPQFEFDSTCGYPGEGPPDLSVSLLRHWISCLAFASDRLGFRPQWIFPLCDYAHGILLQPIPLPSFSPPAIYSCLLVTVLLFPCAASPRPKKSKAVVSYGTKRWLLILVLQQFVSLASAVGHGTVLLPRDAGDRKRASARGDLALEEGRPVLQKTQLHRDKLLTWFKEWLISEGVNFDDLILVGNPDIDAINVLLQRYGRSLFRAGRPYGHYAETVNAVAGKRPRLRRQLQPAWDLAYTWMRQEPPNHHTALPWQVLLCMLSTAISWGWPQVAGILALSWGGLTRIGEALGALRKHLVLPQDVEFTSPYILLQIGEPKTRFRAARHQVAKVDQPQLVKMIEIAFRNLAPEQRLWPYSGQTMRQRFQKLLSALRLDTLKNHLARGLDLGSLRAGGASWLLMTSEDSELTRRRGRWITSKIMEIHVQEVSSLQFMPSLPSDVKKLIVEGMTLFPWILAQADELCRARIPDQAWSLVLRNAAASTERNGYVSKKGRVGVFQDT